MTTQRRTMISSVATLLLAAPCFAQPIHVRYHVGEYSTNTQSTISQKVGEQFQSFAGLHATNDKAPVLRIHDGWLAVVPYGGQVTALTATLESGFGDDSHSFIAFPLEVSWLTSWDFVQFGFAGSGHTDAEFFTDFFPGTANPAGNVVSYNADQVRWEWNAASVMLFGPAGNFGWIILGGTHDADFVNPKLLVTYYVFGDLWGSSALDLADIDRMGFYHNQGIYDDRGDWDNDGDLDHIDLADAVAAAEIIPGDANDDGKVDAQDLNRVGINWQTGGHTWSDGDFTYDGFVSQADLNIIGINWSP